MSEGLHRAEWDVLRALFEGALERGAAERAAFLDEGTKDDPQLRRDIESLLAAHDGAGDFLSAPALGPPPAEPPDLPLPPDRSASGQARLAAGASLGAFTIVEPLGAGGMGEVYRARDTRLDRQVAIKVLSSDRDTAPGSRERFEREARAISRLSHPRICTIHDVGVAEIAGSTVPYLVMELLDGETLAARIARGPLSIEQATAFAIDIADALVAAHGQGIVHRDLKPANVMLTSTGVKLLDFGLAQLRAPEANPTAVASGGSASLTDTGLVFGTVPYMSPEQLRGERVDARTDIFAFGALLHEMLTGQRPFAADSQAALIAAILEHDAPDVSELQPLAPANLDRIVQKCLAKNPDDRWQTARDLKSELVWVREGREDVRPARRSVAHPEARRAWRGMWALIPAVVVLLLIVNAWRAGRLAPVPQPRQVMRLSLNFPPGVRLGIPINGTSIAIAPDGSRVAFLGVRDGRTSLFIHTLADDKTLDVPNSVGAGTPMFSPDSQSVAFNYEGDIRRVPAATGVPMQVLAEKANNQVTWLPDGRIVSGGPRPLRLIGNEPRDLSRLGQGEEGHHMPVLTPDGSLLFSVIRGGYASSANSIAVVPPDSLEKREVLSNATSPRLIGPDAMIFAQGRTLVATRFDSRGVRVIGEPRPLFDVQTTGYSGAPMYAVAGNGTLVYAEPAAARRLVWVDRDGRELSAGTDERMFNFVRLSPDGTRVAATIFDADRDLWVFALDGSQALQMTSGPDRDARPVWSRDGKEVFFSASERHIARVPADRSTPPVTFFRIEGPDQIQPLSITPDGKRLLMMWSRLPERADLRVLELGSTPTTLTRLIDDSRFDQEGRLSPDGRWLVYESAESTSTTRTDDQIVVRPFPDIQAGRWVISRTGSAPIWSRDGREIFYRDDGAVMAVPVATTPTFKFGRPVRLMEPTSTLGGATYDVSLDGKRFLFIKAPDRDIRSLKVVLNWDVAVNATLAASGAAKR